MKAIDLFESHHDQLNTAFVLFSETFILFSEVNEPKINI